MSRPAKILLVQTANSNLGDNVIADNHAWLIKKAAGLRKIHIFNYSIASRDIGQIKYADAVIFAGGILKITNEKFCLYIPEIIQEAERHGIPVYMSNFGVEQFYADDERSQALKEAVNLPCVKGIAARDDIETLKRDYLEGENVSKAFPVTDIAIWSARSYKKYLKETRPNSPYYRKDTFLKDSSSGKSDAPIGLGIVRHRLFEDYGHPEVTKDIQMDFWLGVIDELDRRSLKWVIFTNGDAYDEEFAREVLEKAGRGSKLPAPLDGAALVRMISGFKGVIAGRMHSNIISYALGLPSVGFIWNRKLEFWGQKIGHPERFLKVDEMDPVKAVDILVSALDRPCGPSKDMLYAIRTPLKEFLKKWVFTSEPSIHRVSFSHEKLAHTLAANHLGTLRCRYPGTDSYEALCSSAYNGFRNFIADLRLTSDGELICINRWHKDTYKMLGFDCSCLEDPGKGISSEEIGRASCRERV